MRNVNTETEQILAAKEKGRLALFGTYLKLSGPGWLLSAITLGGGSLSGALFLGVIGGYEFMWVQMLAMIMGVIMLAAISYVTLSIQKSPFQTLKNEINPVLAWGWLFATLIANLVWVLPQFSLAYAALSQNLLPDVFAGAEGNSSKYIVSVLVLAISIGVTFFYGKQGIGIKIYEWALKALVGGIVLCFVGVVIKLATTASDFQFSKVLVGFIPDFGMWFRPASIYQEYLSSLDPAQKAYWTKVIVSEQRTCIIGAAAAAVGINMTFMFPFSMLNKGWGKEHRGLAIFDLSTGMTIPFVVSVSCIVIASAYMFHGKPYEGLLTEKAGQVILNEENVGYKPLKKYLDKRDKAPSLNDKALSTTEIKLASLLIKRDAGAFANSLATLTANKKFAHSIFGLGIFAMVLSTISMLMLISGFVFSEMFNQPHGGLVHRLGILCGVSGVLWPIWWQGQSKAFLAVVTSTIGYILLPIAFLAFIVMMNSKKILGDDIPKGKARLIWNSLMGVSLLITGSAAAFTATTKKLSLFGQKNIPIGIILFVVFILLTIYSQWKMSKKTINH